MQGFAGTPVDVNALTYDYLAPVGAAGASFPRQGRYYVAVDSARDPFTGATARRPLRPALLGERRDAAVLAASDDTRVGRTPDARLPHARHAVRRRPGSLTSATRAPSSRVGSFDWQTGIAVFPLPTSVPVLTAGTTLRTTMIASDYQEAKNIDTIGPSIMPNTRTMVSAMRVVRGVAVDWLTPAAGACVHAGARALVAASAPGGVASVRFALDGRQFAVDRSGDQGLWSTGLPALKQGAHRLTATAVAAHRVASATRMVRLCRG